MNLNENDDFGFTFKTDEELIPQTDRIKLETIRNLIIPFLDNLAKDPDKPNIHWPNRKEKIEAFKKKINKIIDD
ncbi:hypothetical protein UFOVP787_44 [uncultured Caudovirales phage]|uniref:Uncharacterized protein n=1 Tax=uncultured Caudovirales phage TaxID=2100421 RepID=A0A6J5NSV6_9CAUD|nr:hypothetical protein UFOVP787_44 [uncultured Caudovirales phage]